MRTTSWVIVDKATDKAVREIFSMRLVMLLNRDKYKAVPILEYLQSLNADIKAGVNTHRYT